MSEPQTQQKEESQKTVVSFVFGLLIGGLLVWAFMGGDNAPSDQVTSGNDDNNAAEVDDNTATDDNEAATNTADSADDMATLPSGNGALKLGTVPAGMSVSLEGATYPVKEGWVGVRDYSEDRMGPILGVVRFSEAQGLIPKDIVLQRPTIAGKEYAIVFFNEDGDRRFNSASDSMVQTELSTFTAN